MIYTEDFPGLETALKSILCTEDQSKIFGKPRCQINTLAFIESVDLLRFEQLKKQDEFWMQLRWES